MLKNNVSLWSECFDYMQGRFEILSLSGSFLPQENDGICSRTGGLSVSLAGPDGRVIGGGVAGMLMAAGPVQVISFLPSLSAQSIFFCKSIY